MAIYGTEHSVFMTKLILGRASNYYPFQKYQQNIINVELKLFDNTKNHLETLFLEHFHISGLERQTSLCELGCNAIDLSHAPSRSLLHQTG